MPTKPSVQCVNGLELVGFLRFVLATSVALFHIWTTAFPDAGRHAVVGFFCVSGFLVTKIATESYNDRPLAFLLNRALRIFPTYWACLAIAVTIGILFDEPSKQLSYFSAAWPETAGGWVNNITLFRLAPDATKFISQAWSLEVELYFYFVIGLCTYRSFLLTITCLLFTLVYAVFAISKLTLYPFYWTPYGVGFAFFAGSFAYFISSRIALGWRAIIASATLYAVMMYCLPLTPLSGNVFQYCIVISAAVVTVLLTALPSVSVPRSGVVRISAYLGRLAYSLFLLHLFIAVPVGVAVGPENRPLVFLLTYVLMLVTSILLVNYIELPIERLRKRIRGRPSLDVELASQATISGSWPRLGKLLLDR